MSVQKEVYCMDFLSAQYSGEHMQWCAKVRLSGPRYCRCTTSLKRRSGLGRSHGQDTVRNLKIYSSQQEKNMADFKTQKEWEAYCADELAQVRPLLVEIGIT